MKEKKPIVVGTIAFDRIFSVQPSISKEAERGRIKKEITANETQFMNLGFVASDVKTLKGGTAGNIAYTLGILGKHPVMFSAVGDDFRTSGYEAFLRGNGVEIAVDCFTGQVSACCYQISDEYDNQITIWQSNAYDHVDEIGLNEHVKEAAKDTELAIFSTGNPVGMLRHMDELRVLNPSAKIIFDPGPRVVSYDQEQLRKSLEMCDMLTVNETELQRISAFGFSEKELLENHVEVIIETLGSKGSFIKTHSAKFRVGAVTPVRVRETTGAGDAFRAGLMVGLLEGKSIVEAARIGSVVASYCIEDTGPQSHRITREDVKKRLQRVEASRIE
ncbi:MAG: PfkB family carbohydrate kinase [Candidatus Odinarchaeota archaeon]